MKRNEADRVFQQPVMRESGFPIFKEMRTALSWRGLWCMLHIQQDMGLDTLFCDGVWGMIDT